VFGYGENTLVWEPDLLLARSPGDTAYDVTVSGSRSRRPDDFAYQVILFDPGPLAGMPADAARAAG